LKSRSTTSSLLENNTDSRYNAMAPNTLESDILLNKTNLLIAQNQRLVASWLPLKRKAEELQHARSKEEIESEEQEMFSTPMPELYVYGGMVLHVG